MVEGHSKQNTVELDPLRADEQPDGLRMTGSCLKGSCPKQRGIKAAIK